jgi:hypothetical protein
MNASERLHAARSLVREGRHEEALREYVWFFEHALEENPALAAVRLSYALGDWIELAAVYPKARHALEEIRDGKAQLLRLGAAGWKVFYDVVAINEYLGCEEETYALFKSLVASDPSFAERCSAIALRSILRERDYELAERFLPDPFEEIRRHGELLNRTIRRRRMSKYSPAPRIKSDIDYYAGKVKQMVAVLEGRGRVADARKLRAFATRLIQATTIREAVAAALEPGARPWYERGRAR